VFGLGWNAFASITKAASEPYSHNVYLDILCELGLPMFLLLLVVLRNCASSGLNLFKLVRETRGPRAWVTTFLALAAYHLLLAGKQSFLWATGPLFMHFLLLNRLDLRQREFGWADPPADSLDVSDGQQNPQGGVSAARH